MFEPHRLNDRPDDAFEARLRVVRPSPPQIDRDRLMFLAGRRSATQVRRANRLWPVLTVASWVTCAAIVGLLAMRPAQVVTTVRVVERVIEVPVEPTPAPVEAVEEPQPVADAGRTVAPPLEPGFRFLDDLRRPLTALASRPSLFENLTEPTALVSVEASVDVPAEPSDPKSYSDLRRELLGEGETASFAPFRWF